MKSELAELTINVAMVYSFCIIALRRAYKLIRKRPRAKRQNGNGCEQVSQKENYKKSIAS